VEGIEFDRLFEMEDCALQPIVGKLVEIIAMFEAP
jgi:hypothetical protein